QQLDVTVTAQPNNRLGLVSGHVDIHTDLAITPDRRVTLTGNATTAGIAFPAMVDFGSVDIDGAAPPQTIMLANNGVAILDVSSITKMAGASPSFSVTLPSGATQVTPGTTLALQVTYTPTVDMPANQPETMVLVATLAGIFGGPNQVMITVKGRGIDRHIVVDAMEAFPPTFRNPGDSAPIKTVTVHNNGEATLHIAGVMVTGAPVWELLDGSAIDLPGGGSHDFLVKFSPTMIGAAPTGQLTIVNNDNAKPMAVVTLTGTGIGRNVAFGPPTIDLGYTGVGIPLTTDMLMVTNMDPAVSFKIHAISLADGTAFRIENPPADVELSTTPKNFALTFDPTMEGDFTTTARLYLDQDDQVQAEVQITGHAVFVNAHGSGGCHAGGNRPGSGSVLALGVLAALGSLGQRRWRRRRRGLATAVTALVATVAFAPAVRADGIAIAAFAPTPATTGTGFQLQSPEVGAGGSWVASSILSYASNPLVLDARKPDGTIVNRDTLVERSSLLQLGGAYAFLDRFEAGAHLPLFMQSGQAAGDPHMGFTTKPASGTARGNLTLHAKARLGRGGGGHGTFAAGASAVVVVPTATKGQFTGSDQPEGRLLLLGSFTPAALGSRLAISANAGGVLRGTSEYANIVQKSGVAWGAGASVRVADALWASAEVFGEATPSGKRQQGGTGTMPPAAVLSPVEWLAGINYKLDPRITVGLAAGRGLTDAIGTPAVRGVFSLAFVPGAAAVAPIHSPESARPDGDADGDGIPDSVDKCPNEPEDKDMFEDQDGCPDPDNDHDGIPDAKDKCPLDPEDKDGFQDEDGCPEKDNDGDGIPDAKDKCPNEPEDKDGFQDLDGCPEPDNDHDGIPDAKDRCPNEPETINGVQDDDGCPDKGDTTIILSPDRIETLDPIQFTGLKLTKASLPLLEQVGATLRAHPEIVRLRITMHVQPTADADADQAKSTKRAQALRDWLVQWGIAPSRLEVRGFGGEKPLVPPDQRGAARINDRLEFIILERK
ncbi:MAG TPA: choice-of-anchor D domain-containing protein, partial [Kofleriaceae bacterium]|nr:choice-of-anchor D domain-containing protein [Kofleriaceae bacterium]